MHTTTHKSKDKAGQGRLQVVTSNGCEQPSAPPWLTLLEGLGGFGQQVVQAAKHRDLDEAANVRIQVMDIDGSHAAAYAPGAFIHLGDVPVHQVLAKLRIDPEAYSGLRYRIGDLDQLYQAMRASDDLSRGALQDRPLGIIGVDVTLEQQGYHIESQMMQPLYQLYRYASQLCLTGNGSHGPGHLRSPLIQRIAFSAGGGAGSAMALVMAYLHSHHRRKFGIRPVFVEAVVALPALFPIEDPEYILANSYALLLEMMAAYQKPQPPLTYSSIGQVQRDAPPFSLFYLVDGMNANGEQITDPAQMAQIVAEGWRVMGSAKMGEHYHSVVQNVLPKLGDPYIASSFGIAGLQLPVDEMITQNSYRLGERLMVAHLLGPVSEAVKEQNQEGLHLFIHQTGLRTLGRVFDTDETGQAIKISLDPFRSYPRRQLPGALEQYWKEQASRWEKALAKQGHMTSLRLKTAMDEQVERLLNHQVGGLQQAHEFLGVEEGSASSGLSQVVEQMLHDLNRQLAYTQVQRDTLHQQTIKRAQVPFYRRLTPTPRKAYFMRKQAAFELELRMRKLVTQITVIDELLHHIYRQAEQVDSWQVTLTALAERLLDRARMFAQERVANQAVVITNVLCPEEEEQLYQQGLPQALSFARQGVVFTREGADFLLTYRTRDADQTSHRLAVLSEAGIQQCLRFTQQFWQQLRNLSVEGLLGERGERPEQLAANLEHRAAPLISIKQVKQHQPVITQVVMGSEHGNQGFFRGWVAKAGVSLVATGDPHRIDFLYTIHGIHPMALAQSEAMAQAYRKLRQAGKYLHVRPESELNLAQEADHETV